MEIHADHRAEGPLRIESRRESDLHRIQLKGEWDLAYAEVMERELLSAEASDAAEIVIDLDELEFIDSSAVEILQSAVERSKDRVRLAGSPLEQVRQVLELTGICEILRCEG